MCYFALYVRVSEDRPANGIPSIKVVKSESMAEKNPKNTYLYNNDLDDQIQMFDIVICRHLPPEDELELYDVVVYKKDDMHVTAGLPYGYKMVRRKQISNPGRFLSLSGILLDK